jgi:carbamate kinase
MAKKKSSKPRKRVLKKVKKPAKKVPQSRGTAVIALGGNALIKKGQIGTYTEQLNNIYSAVDSMVKLVKKGWKVVLTHGNGPQVGSILIQQESGKSAKMPLHACVAESQALIGCMIQEALYNRLHKEKVRKPVVTMVTQVLVSPNDPAFKKPTKPIGPYYEDETDIPSNWHIARTKRGYRRVVPSPEPKEIIEAEAIKYLSDQAVVIACGGGGVPVIKGLCKPGKKAFSYCGLRGVAAVIDKDLAAQKLAEVVGADHLIVLTDVDQVSLNYGRQSEYKLGSIKHADAKKYLKAGHFPPGSMGPKIEASLRFLDKRKDGKVIITSFGLLDKALAGKAGTVITR